MPNFVPTAPADPVAGQPGHFAHSNWTKQAILLLDAIFPVGMILPYPGATAPDGWAICDGSAHGNAALLAFLSSANTPDYRGRVLMGASATYPLGTTGGVDAVTLTAAQSGLRDHGHSAWTGGMDANDVHSHSAWTGTDGAHIHNSFGSQALTAEGDVNPAGAGSKYLIGIDGLLISSSSSAHAHAVGVGATSIDHAHAVGIGSSGAADASAAHTNLQPYATVNWIIKKGAA